MEFDAVQFDAVEFDTFHHAYTAVLRSLVDEPSYRNAPRGQPSSERLGVQYRLRRPSQRVPLVPARRLNIAFNLAEALWYLSGRDDLDFIGYYAPGMHKYSADGVRLTGTAYGRAIFGGDGRPDQWRAVVDQLRDDPDSKRAVVQIFRGEELAVPGNPDVSCTLGVQFLVREGVLHAMAFMRANDAYRGMSSDVFSFTFLQELMARELGLRLGGYVHSVGSMHVYDSDARRAREVLADPAAAADPELPFPEMPEGDNWPFVRRVLDLEEPLRLDRHRLDPDVDLNGLPDYWAQVLLVLELHRAVRHGGAPDAGAVAMLWPCYRWLVGRWRPDLVADPVTLPC
ncbi:thymidylate synthase [Saccharothrix saharensis]|uniref:thymidylate synthase n=1 Tax=Saccharothrix saharensis TaxID=571190 RepID=A0A543JQT0_9PSEU|nr:thymidylate synthase [Saccharothrix saharensis]TQM85211.1 thymidylate synthase [Saccharothrix saharensis]